MSTKYILTTANPEPVVPPRPEPSFPHSDVFWVVLGGVVTAGVIGFFSSVFKASEKNTIQEQQLQYIKEGHAKLEALTVEIRQDFRRLIARSNKTMSQVEILRAEVRLLQERVGVIEARYFSCDNDNHNHSQR